MFAPITSTVSWFSQSISKLLLSRVTSSKGLSIRCSVNRIPETCTFQFTMFGWKHSVRDWGCSYSITNFLFVNMANKKTFAIPHRLDPNPPECAVFRYMRTLLLFLLPVKLQICWLKLINGTLLVVLLPLHSIPSTSRISPPVVRTVPMRTSVSDVLLSPSRVSAGEFRWDWEGALSCEDRSWLQKNRIIEKQLTASNEPRATKVGGIFLKRRRILTCDDDIANRCEWANLISRLTSSKVKAQPRTSEWPLPAYEWVWVLKWDTRNWKLINTL